MSNQLQAVLHQPANEVLPSLQQWELMLKMAETLVKSGFLPKAIDTPAKATAIILKGREIGIPAMYSFAHINVIDGKPTCSAELQLALMARGGVTWEWLQDGSAGTASLCFYRQGFKPFTSTFTTADAQRAGLLEKQNWQKYPAPMRCARAISNGARKIGPDLIAGMSYTAEELGSEEDEGYVVESRMIENRDQPHLEPPQTVKTPAGTVDAHTGEIVDSEPLQGITSNSEGLVVDSEKTEEEEVEQTERAALIVEIERGEQVFRLTPKQKIEKRVKYMGNIDFDATSLDGLLEYARILNKAIKTGAGVS